MAGFSKKKYFKLAKGFYGRVKNCLRLTIPKVEKGLCKAYIGRKQRPRTLKNNWIMAINAGVRDLGYNYSRFIFGLNSSNIHLDRKILANLVCNEPYTFKAVVDEVHLQCDQFQQKKRYNLEQMIRNNLVTAAKLSNQDYKSIEKTGIRLRF